MANYFPPEFEGSAFNCTYCDVYATQRWVTLFARDLVGSFNTVYGFNRCTCSKCQGESFWFDGKQVVPALSTAPLAHELLPEDCKADYEEARNIVAASPKAAAALMRLVIQKLMKSLGESGKNINDDIKSLVAKGLPPLIQKALDYCRVVGNHAVHPGEIELNDSPEIAKQLFAMVNYIVEDRIARPREIEAMYESLPDSAKEAITRRDGKHLP
jgi:hypothetical protein